MTAAAVEVRGLGKSFGQSAEPAIDQLSFDIAEGEFLVLLGPSGCGKTTTLRCLAGLETADHGQIVLRQEVVFDPELRINQPPDKRNIGMVFQSYALWPHMTVRRNLEYPLKARRLREGLSSGWVEQVARLVECDQLLERYPSQLSGGQQQRVALARGLISRPDLILFDEPLSNLDARLRRAVRSELHLLHRQLGFTAVYVTHDQEEAFALADRLVIMRDGRVEQSGSPVEIYRNPTSDYVAEFIGMANRLSVDRRGGVWRAGAHALHHLQAPLDAADRGPTTLRLRPEDVVVRAAREDDRDGYLSLPGKFVDSSFAGRVQDVIVDVGDDRVLAHIPTADSDPDVEDVRPGDDVWISFQAVRACLFDDGGARVRQVVRRADSGTELDTNGPIRRSTGVER